MCSVVTRGWLLLLLSEYILKLVLPLIDWIGLGDLLPKKQEQDVLSCILVQVLLVACIACRATACIVALRDTHLSCSVAACDVSETFV